MNFNETEMSFESEAQEPVNAYNERRAAGSASDAAMYAQDPAVYFEVKTDLQDTGYSATFERIKAHAQEHSVRSAIPTAAKQDATGAKDVLTQAQREPLEVSALKKSADNYVPMQWEDFARIEQGEEFLADIAEGSAAVDQAVMQAFEKVLGEEGVTILEGITSGANLLLAPGGETSLSVDFVRTFKEHLGLSTAGSDYLVGAGTEEVKEEFYRARTPEEQLRVLDAIVYSLQKSDSYIGSDELQKLFTLNTILSDYIQGSGNPSVRELEIYADNVLPLIDLLGVTKLISASTLAMQGVRRLTKADKIAQLNPTAARTATVDAIDSPEIAKALESSPEELLGHSVVPKWRSDAGEDVSLVTAPTNVLNQLEILQGKADEVVDRLSRRGYMVPERIQAQAVEDAREYLTKGTPFSVDHGSANVAPLDDGLLMQARYNMTADGTKWATEEEALAAGRSVFTDPDVVVKAIPSHQAVQGPVETNPSGWSFAVEWKRPYDDVSVGKFQDSDFPITTGVADYITDFSSKLSKELSQANARAFDISRYAASELNSFLKPFDKINNKSRSRVVNWLEEGQGSKPTQAEGFVYTPEQLVAKGATEGEMTAYYAARSLNDALWIINNTRFRDSLKARGYEQMVKVSADNPLYRSGVPYKPVTDINEIPRTVTEVWNPSTGRMVPLTPGTIVGKLLDDVTDGTNNTRFVMLNAQTTKALPRAVLKYDQGYVTTKYKDGYIVQRQGNTKVVDGIETQYSKAVQMHPDLNSAKASVARLERARTTELDALRAAQRDFPSEALKARIKELSARSYRPLHESALDNRDRIRAEFDIEKIKGRVFFSKKGEQLEGSAGLAEVTDLIASMQRALQITARAGVYERLVQNHKQRFLNTYRDLLDSDIRQAGAYPTSIRQINARNSTKGLADNKRARKAQSAFRMIEKIENPEGALSAWYQERMIAVADSLGGGVPTKAALFLAKHGPLKTLRAFNFVTMLALNPARQVFVQSQQFLFLSALQPTYMAKLPADYMALMAGYMAKPSKAAKGVYPFTLDDVAPGAARVLGVSVDEYKATVKSFRESGLPNSIDSHMISHDAAVDMQTEVAKGMLSYSAQIGTKVLKTALNVPKKVGFDFGEFNNLTATWLIARKEYLKENPTALLSSSKVTDEIAARARSYALDMTSQGGFPYQKGILSAMTQFLSIQHKAWLAVLPQKLGGNKAFTGAQKTRIAVSQLLLYGASGWGLNKVYDKIKEHFQLETTAEADHAFKAGMYEWIVNAALTAMTGEDQDLAISENIAAGGGTIDSVGKIVTAITMGERTALDIYLGAGASSQDRISAAVRHVAWVTRNPGLDTDEKLLRSMEILGGLTSGVSNYTKYRMSMNQESAVSANGSPVVQNTYLERVAKGVLGLSTQDEQDFYQILKHTGARKKAIKADAQLFMDMYLKDISRFELAEGDGASERQLQAYKYSDAFFGYMMELLGPEDGTAMWYEMQEIMRMQSSIDGMSSVTQRVIQSVGEGRFGDDPWNALELLEQHNQITRAQKEALLQAFESATQKIPELYGQ